MIEEAAAQNSWQLVFNAYEPADEGRREALCALGNGYVVTRAAILGASTDDVHYPGTYRAGLYNRLVSHIHGQAVEEESLVRLPDWLALGFRIDGNEWFSVDEVELLDYLQTLDLRRGLLLRELRFCDRQGRRTRLRERRLVSMAQPHLAGLELELEAEDWSGELEIRSPLDGRIKNDNVERYAPYQDDHLEPLETGALEREGIWLKVRTKQSRTEVALAARTRLRLKDSTLDPAREVEQEAAHVAEHFRCRLGRGTSVTVEKVAALYTSRDFAISESGDAARQALRRAPSFEGLLEAHQRAWERLWERCHLELDQDDHLRAMRLHMFHLLQTASPHSSDLDAGIPSRGWHGEAYRGHIFWDELFVFQFLSFRLPALARALLLYRYRRLDEARHMAKEHGCRGAMFPWRSASSGREETPRFQLNPLSGRWMQDHTRRQRHIGAAIAYNLLHYTRVTGDSEFLHDYGAELLLEIARFWASLASYNAALDRFEIHGVVGPDEYHNAYPQAERPGLDNNGYTNLMAVWTLQKALEVLEALAPERRDELWQKLQLSQDELEHWDSVSRKMRVVFHDGMLSQFEGFERLRELDLAAFREQHGEGRVDWLLEAMGESADHYQVSKQADVMMLLYLFSEAEVLALLARLGYACDRDMLERTARYYLQRTSHGSSLSRMAYASVFARLDLATSWRLFTEAQFTDLAAFASESVAEGLHLGAMAGTIHVLQNCYLGLDAQEDALHLDPVLLEEIGRCRIGVHYRRNELLLELTDAQLRVRSAPSNKGVVRVVFRGQAKELKPGTSETFN